MVKKIAAAALAALVLSGVAGAAKHGTTLTVSPAKPAVGQTATLAGCGYKPSAEVQLYVAGGAFDKTTGTSEVFFVAYFDSDAAGCVSFSWTITKAGNYQVALYQENNSETSYIIKFKLTFTAVP